MYFRVFAIGAADPAVLSVIGAFDCQVKAKGQHVGRGLNPREESSDLFVDNLDATVVTRPRWHNSQPERSTPLWLIPVLGMLLCSQASAQSHQEVLVRERQVKALARVLAYDDKLPNRAGTTVVLAVLYKPGNPSSEKEATESFSQFAKLESYRILGLPFHSVKLPFTSVDALDRAIGSQGIVALYVCPGLDDEIANLKRISRKHKATTIASREEQLAAGLALGVFSLDGQLTVVVNLPASREEGARFSSDLLRLARVIQ